MQEALPTGVGVGQGGLLVQSGAAHTLETQGPLFPRSLSWLYPLCKCI